MGGAVGTGGSITVARDRTPPLGVGGAPAASPACGPRGEDAGGDRRPEARPRVRLWDDTGAYSPASLAKTVVAISEDRTAP